MPSGKQYMNFVIINLAFIAQVCLLYYWIMVENIKADWVNQRCNPMFMFFADNIEENFQYCVQNMQSNYMGYLLQPLTYITGALANIGEDFNFNIDSIRNMINNIRDSITNIFQSIFGVFLNIVIEFQRLTISIKDMIGKVIGTMTVLMYILSGSQLTMESMWNGPSGQLVKHLGSACFHPETKIKLFNNDIVYIKDLYPGNILKNGSIVVNVLKFENVSNEQLYVFKNKGEDGEDIYVTGEHYITYKNKWIKVKDHDYSYQQTKVKSKELINLITHNNNICIGDYLFWDYNDDIFEHI